MVGNAHFPSHILLICNKFLIVTLSNFLKFLPKKVKSVIQILSRVIWTLIFIPVQIISQILVMLFFLFGKGCTISRSKNFLKYIRWNVLSLLIIPKRHEFVLIFLWMYSQNCLKMKTFDQLKKQYYKHQLSVIRLFLSIIALEFLDQILFFKSIVSSKWGKK